MTRTPDPIVDAASAARRLLSKLQSRIEIDIELLAEIDAVETQLWNALFPGAKCELQARERLAKALRAPKGAEKAVKP